jgi:hypothetical protein
MDQKQISSARIEKLDKGTFQRERITVNVSSGDKAAFLQNPELFIRNVLVAQKETVNGFTIGASQLAAMKREVTTGQGPVTPLVIFVWHCEAPPEHASERIAIERPPIRD